MKTKKVQLDNKTITVKKLPLGKYAELLSALDELPKKVSGLEGLSNDEIFANLPKLLAEALPEVIKVLCIATELDEKEVNEMGLDEVTRIVVAVAEVNNFREVFDNLKNLTARQSLPQQNQKTA